MLTYMDDKKLCTLFANAQEAEEYSSAATRPERGPVSQARQDCADLLKSFRSDLHFCDVHTEVLDQVVNSATLIWPDVSLSTFPSWKRASLQVAISVLFAIQQLNRRFFEDEQRRNEAARLRSSQLFRVVSEIAARMTSYYTGANSSALREDVRNTKDVGEWMVSGRRPSLFASRDPDAHRAATQADPKIGAGNKYNEILQALRLDSDFTSLLELNLPQMLAQPQAGQTHRSVVAQGIVPSGNETDTLGAILERLEQGFDPAVDYVTDGQTMTWTIPELDARATLLLEIIREVSLRVAATYISNEGRTLSGEAQQSIKH